MSKTTSNLLGAINPTRRGRSEKPNVLIASAVMCLILFANSTDAKGQTVSLGSAENFTIVSAAGVTNAGSSVISGNIALSPTPTITGFAVGEGVVTGVIHSNDDLAIQAQSDALAAFNTLASLPFVAAKDLTGLDLGGMTLTPGIYHFDVAAGLTGTLILDTQNDPNAVFVFQIGSTLTTAVGSAVIVTGAGAGSDPNVFWQIGTSATLNASTEFDGNILAFASISFGMDSNIENGRAIALNGAVTLLSNDITPADVPEPSTWVMLFAGMSVLVFWNLQRIRRHSKA